MKYSSDNIDKIPNEVYESLDYLGIPQHILGYNYLAYAISIMLDNPAERVSITKDLYPGVAKAFDTTSSRVERAIRHAVTRAFEVSNPEVLYNYFGNAIDCNKATVPNSQFIHAVVNKLHRKLHK